jgi:hypothetical protein
MKIWYLHNGAPGLTSFPVITPTTEISLELELKENITLNFIVLQSSLLYTNSQG